MRFYVELLSSHGAYDDGMPPTLTSPLLAVRFAHAGMTAEGDNRVLMQKVAKELLSSAGSPRVQARIKVTMAAALGMQPIAWLGMMVVPRLVMLSHCGVMI